MAKTVIGLYERFDQARQVAADLINQGFAERDISLITSGDRGNTNIAAPGEEHVQEEEVSAAESAGLGAVVGGVAGLLAGFASLMIPGFGPVLAVGPLLAALGGAGLGAVAGGLAEALADAGVPESDARTYAAGLQRGGVLVAVDTDDAQADHAADIMNRYHPVDLEARPSGEAGAVAGGSFETARTSPVEKRDRQQPVDARGARTYIVPAQTIGEFDRQQMNLKDHQNEPTGTAGDWRMFESRFRHHYEQQYARPGSRWEEYRDSYRFGFDLAHLPQFNNAEWDMIYSDLRQALEARYPSLQWEDVEDAVKEGWEMGRTPR